MNVSSQYNGQSQAFRDKNKCTRTYPSAEPGRCNDKLAGEWKTTYCAENRLSNRFIYGCESDQLGSERLVEIIISHINSMFLTKNRYAID